MFFFYVNLYLYRHGFTGLPIGVINKETTDIEKLMPTIVIMRTTNIDNHDI
jgi:hypothetical protein